MELGSRLSSADEQGKKSARMVSDYSGAAKSSSKKQNRNLHCHRSIVPDKAADVRENHSTASLPR